jgi:hypothetical protein
MGKRRELNGVKEKDAHTLRVRVYPDELQMLNELRSLWNVAVDKGINPEEVKHGWIKDNNASLFIKNHAYKDPETAAVEKSFKKLLEKFKTYSPVYPTIVRDKGLNGHLLIIDIADLHINKYATSELTGAEYNSKKAVERAIEGTKGLLQKSSGFDIDRVLFVIGNDVLNTDNLSKSTTKFTPQDTDVSWHEAFKIAYECYVKCIELCLSVADVDVIHCPSNHDFMSGTFLAETLKAHFRLSENSTFDTSPAYRKYYQYFNNLIELEHGDKGKISDLPLVIAQQQPKMWAECKFRYGYIHHVHHSIKRDFQSSKDYIGVNVTYLRSPSSADIWHADNGYLNMVAVEGFIHSKQNGRVSHITHYF